MRKGILLLFAASLFWVFLVHWGAAVLGIRKISDGVRPVLSFDSMEPPSALFSSSLIGSVQPGTSEGKQNKIHSRTFEWEDPGKIKRRTTLLIPDQDLKKEIRKFGTTHNVPHPLLLRSRGFKILARKHLVLSRSIQEQITSIVDYKQIFDRNLSYFSLLTPQLADSAQLSPGSDPLYSFLTFVQHIPYKLPPKKYNGKFINSFFVPLVTLYEQYGDCDSKAVLLADFLCTFPGSTEKTAIVLIRGRGIAHALLVVKRKPLLGQTSLHDIKKGYYVVLETTTPGWSPGFISRRIIETIQAGYFYFVDLN